MPRRIVLIRKRILKHSLFGLLEDQLPSFWLTPRKEGGRCIQDLCHPVGKLSLTNVSNRGPWIFWWTKPSNKNDTARAKSWLAWKSVFPFLGCLDKKICKRPCDWQVIPLVQMPTFRANMPVLKRGCFCAATTNPPPEGAPGLLGPSIWAVPVLHKGSREQMFLAMIVTPKPLSPTIDNITWVTSSLHRFGCRTKRLWSVGL